MLVLLKCALKNNCMDGNTLKGFLNDKRIHDENKSVTTVTRKTGETDITITLTLDGTQEIHVDTGIGFLDHMLHLLAKHGRFGLAVKAVGDTYVDAHHTVEDIALTLGQALTQALGDKAVSSVMAMRGCLWMKR